MREQRGVPDRGGPGCFPGRAASRTRRLECRGAPRVRLRTLPGSPGPPAHRFPVEGGSNLVKRLVLSPDIGQPGRAAELAEKILEHPLLHPNVYRIEERRGAARRENGRACFLRLLGVRAAVEAEAHAIPLVKVFEPALSAFCMNAGRNGPLPPAPPISAREIGFFPSPRFFVIELPNRFGSRETRQSEVEMGGAEGYRSIRQNSFELGPRPPHAPRVIRLDETSEFGLSAVEADRSENRRVFLDESFRRRRA